MNISKATPAEAMTEMRLKAPLVHCITNYVAMNFAANVCLAAGASPAMVHAPEEVEDFTPIAGALTINIGTLSTPWVEGMLRAARAANSNQVHWVFDPVAHFISPFRSDIAQQLLALKPAILRGNASEILALAGQQGSGKGVDSGDEVSDAEAAARTLALQTEGTVVVTGATDFVTDGTQSARISGGSELMPMVTAMGCSLTALMGAYASVAPPFIAAQTALAHFKAAGSLAAPIANGPGSFQMHFLDALASVQAEDLAAHVHD